MLHLTQSRSYHRRSSQPITWLILTNKTLQESTQTKYNSQNKQRKTQQNKTTLIQSAFTTLSQETSWAYSTMLLSPRGSLFFTSHSKNSTETNHKNTHLKSP